MDATLLTLVLMSLTGVLGVVLGLIIGMLSSRRVSLAV